MRLFLITPTVPASGGCALVASETLERAYAILHEYDEMLDNEWVSLSGREFTEVEYNGDMSRVLFSHIYVE